MTSLRAAPLATVAEPVEPMLLRQPGPGPAAARAQELLGADGAGDDAGADEGYVFTLCDPAAGAEDLPAAAALVVDDGGGTAELRGFAVDPALPAFAVATRLVREVADRLRSLGFRRLTASPALQRRPSAAILEASGFRLELDL